MRDRLSTRMIALLDQERVAIRTADFDGLAVIADEKGALFNALPDSGATRAELTLIKQRIDANQTLLSAAISGVTAAQDRLTAVRHVRDGLSVYNQSGQMDKVKTPRPGMEKKA